MIKINGAAALASKFGLVGTFRAIRAAGANMIARLRQADGIGGRRKHSQRMTNVRETFSQSILQKYRSVPMPYFDQAYMVLLVTGKVSREGVIPLYAGSRYINYQIKQYIQKEIVREIKYEKPEPTGPQLLQTIHPVKFFEQVNLSTRREWGRLFYSLSKEYEIFYREQYHREPGQVVHYEESGRVIHSRRHEEIISFTSERMIRKALEEQYRERDIRIRTLEERIETYINRINRQEEVMEKQIKIRQEEIPEKVPMDRSEIIGEIMNQLQRQWALERMRHGD